MNVPIVVVAFGTTAKSQETYSVMDKQFKARFPENPIHWAYSSRIVVDKIKNQEKRYFKNPLEILSELSGAGNTWAVVQCLHVSCGHEFHRVLSVLRGLKIRTSVGLPLLTTPEDFQEVAVSYDATMQAADDSAVVLVGHGTDHPSWTSFYSLHHLLRQRYGDRVYVGQVEDGFPSRDSILEDITRQGFKKALIIPFMVVAGVHFLEDLTGDDDSWQRVFQSHGIETSIVDRGVGYDPNIVDIFCRHVEDAMDVIPR